MKKVLIEVPDEYVELYEEYVEYVKREKNEMIMPHNSRMFIAMIKIMLNKNKENNND